MYKIKYVRKDIGEEGFVYSLPKADLFALDGEDQEEANETVFETPDFFYAQSYAEELARRWSEAKYTIIFTGQVH